MSRDTNPYANQWAQFKASTAEHQLTILHDDGLYRHLRMGKPGTGIWSWSVVAWPWHLYVGGDIGLGLTFSREEDMIPFFDTSGYGDYYGDGSPMLQADYWDEKLTAGCRDAAHTYSSERFLRRVRDLLADDYDLEPERAERILMDAEGVAQHEETARQWLGEERYFADADAWEWDLKALDHHYLLACYAIVTTVRAYRTEMQR